MNPRVARHHRFVSLLLCLSIALGSASAVAAQSTPVATPTSAKIEMAPWADDAVCYEIFVRSFADSDGDGIGDLNGLISKLDYLNDGDPATDTDLGVTCVWLMPVFQATSYHGYDVEDYYAIEPDYGTNDDFLRFTEAAHERGIRVILDLVLNHTSNQHPWFLQSTDPTSPYRDWYIWEASDPGYPGPFGTDSWFESPAGDGTFYYGAFNGMMPDLNYENPAVTEEARKISAFWLGQMGADGFRLDAIKHLIEEGEVQADTESTRQWLREYGAWLSAEFPDAFTIGEIFNSTAFILAPYYPDQLDAYFQFELAGQIIIAAAGGNGSGIRTVVNDTAERIPDQRFGTFLSNHDQTRAMTQLGNDPESARLAAATLLTLPGVPFIYYGEEIGMTGNKPDEQLRTPMQWTADSATAGFTDGTPWIAPQPDTASVNVAAQDADPGSLLNHYRSLIRVHAASPAIQHGEFIGLRGATSLAAYLRYDPDSGDLALILINFGDRDLSGEDAAVRIGESALPADDYTLTRVYGPGQGASEVTVSVGEDGEIGEQVVAETIPARSALIFQIA